MPWQIARARREQIDDEQVYALADQFGGLLAERANSVAAVLVSRRDNFDDRDHVAEFVMNRNPIRLLGVTLDFDRQSLWP